MVRQRNVRLVSALTLFTASEFLRSLLEFHSKIRDDILPWPRGPASGMLSVACPSEDFIIILLLQVEDDGDVDTKR